MKLDQDKLDHLMEAGKWDEAKVMLDGYISQMTSAEQMGASYLSLASIYLKVMNRLDADYEATLDETLAALKKLDAAEQSTKDQIGIEDARQKISDLK
jgi:hypothetical protein